MCIKEDKINEWIKRNLPSFWSSTRSSMILAQKVLVQRTSKNKYPTMLVPLLLFESKQVDLLATICWTSHRKQLCLCFSSVDSDEVPNFISLTTSHVFHILALTLARILFQIYYIPIEDGARLPLSLGLLRKKNRINFTLWNCVA